MRKKNARRRAHGRCAATPGTAHFCTLNVDKIVRNAFHMVKDR